MWRGLVYKNIPVVKELAWRGAARCGVSAERFACLTLYDLTSWLDESLKAEVREDALV